MFVIFVAKNFKLYNFARQVNQLSALYVPWDPYTDILNDIGVDLDATAAAAFLWGESHSPLMYTLRLC